MFLDARTRGPHWFDGGVEVLGVSGVVAVQANARCGDAEAIRRAVIEIGIERNDDVFRLPYASRRPRGD
jgi:hypothetical protein